jgi:hypothetical protein
MNGMSSAFDYVDNRQTRFYIWGTQPVERIVEHCETIVNGHIRYFVVKIEQRTYSEPINLKLLNDLWERRGNFIINGEWLDRLHNDKGETIFSVWHDPYWETVYRHQGDNSPRLKAGASRDFHPSSVVPEQVYSSKHSNHGR